MQITPVAESADEILEYDYKATVIQKAFAFKTISFERAANEKTNHGCSLIYSNIIF